MGEFISELHEEAALQQMQAEATHPERTLDSLVGAAALAGEHLITLPGYNLQEQPQQLQRGSRPEKKKPQPSESPQQQPQPPQGTRRRRGHPMKEIKEHLAEKGKLNATKPMSPEQKKLRRRKRK